MLQLWKLVLLCGLLTGTSASLLGNLGNDLSNVVNKLKPVVEKGLETVDNTIESVMQKLKADLGLLQDSKVWQLAKEKVQKIEKLVNEAISKIISVKNGTYGLNILNSRILNIKIELTPDGKGVIIRVPVTANVTMALPLTGQKVNLKASLDLLTDITLKTDAQTGLPKVVVGQCRSDSDTISITLLDGHSPAINKVVNSVATILEKTVAFLIEKDDES
ncbi:BPI fold-containing family A member 2-like [Crocuta crocuta]